MSAHAKNDHTIAFQSVLASCRRWSSTTATIRSGFVVSLNLHRRHLTDAQKSVLALDILPHLEAQARERQAQAVANRHAVQRGVDPERIPELRKAESRDEAAERVGVNPRYVSDTKKIAREAPRLIEKMRAGELTVPAAMRQLKEDQRKVELARPRC